MADLQITPQKVIVLDSDYTANIFFCDDGGRSVAYEDFTEHNYWIVQWDVISQANYDTIFGLWESKMCSTQFTWLNPLDSTQYNVKFYEQPSSIEFFLPNWRRLQAVLVEA